MLARAQRVTVERVPLDCTLTPQQVLRALSDEPWPFALSGKLGRRRCDRRLVPAARRRSAVRIRSRCSTHQPAARTPDDAAAGAVGGGWFGWLGYRLGARVERLPAGPPRPVPLPDFQLAYYDHVLRLDAAGRWWFEALVSDDRRRGARASASTQLRDTARRAARPRCSRSRRRRRSASTTRDAAAHLAAVAACRERIVAGEIYQANICLRLQTSWDGDVVHAVRARAGSASARRTPPRSQAPWGGIASLSPELFLRRRGRDVTTAPIKGTIRRPADPALAAATLRTLRDSAKDARST